MPDHTAYRVFCRHGRGSCEPIPRLNRRMAEQAAQEHADEFGHLAEVVKLQFTTLSRAFPSAAAIGGTP